MRPVRIDRRLKIFGNKMSSTVRPDTKYATWRNTESTPNLRSAFHNVCKMTDIKFARTLKTSAS